MKWPTSILGYTAAGMTLLAAALVPFVLIGTFSKGFTRLGLHVDEMYSGGPVVRTVQAEGYTIGIHKAVHPHFWQTEKPFVQLDWKPAAALPEHVCDVVDVAGAVGRDGYGKEELRVSFDVPKDPKTPLHANVEALNPRFQAMRNVGKPKFSELIVRVDDTILVRVPLAAAR